MMQVPNPRCIRRVARPADSPLDSASAYMTRSEPPSERPSGYLALVATIIAVLVVALLLIALPPNRQFSPVQPVLIVVLLFFVALGIGILIRWQRWVQEELVWLFVLCLVIAGAVVWFSGVLLGLW
jgi:hypothetical protein